MVSAEDLSALVSARLCHDLISPMGAIGNGLELLQLSGGGAGPEIALVNESLATAIAKLRFFRVAFGPADPEARQSIDEAEQITEAMFHGRLSIGWEAEGDLPRPLARIAFLAILCLEKSLPMGGHVRVAATEGGGLALAVRDRRTAPPTAHWDYVVDGMDAPDPSADMVQFPLLRRALLAAGRRLSARFTPEAAEVAIVEVSPAELAEAPS